MDATKQRTLLTLVALLVAVTGCNSSSESGGDAAEQAAAATSGAPENATARLSGLWYGRARVDMNLVQRQMQSLPDPRDRAALQEITRTFLTTEIGARFDQSGEMELDVQIQSPNGGSLRDSTTGTWRVVESSGNVLVVETTEQLPGGGTETSRVRYELGSGDRTAVMPAPTSELLAGCQPVFVFEKVEAVGNAASPPTAR